MSVYLFPKFTKDFYQNATTATRLSFEGCRDLSLGTQSLSFLLAEKYLFNPSNERRNEIEREIKIESERLVKGAYNLAPLACALAALKFVAETTE